MPWVTINIAKPGTPIKESQKTKKPSKSHVGHMWYSLTKGDGSAAESYGFAPAPEREGWPLAPGQVYRNDDTNYEPPCYSRTVVISQGQYDAMKSFGDNPEDSGFSKSYIGVFHDCIDFTWEAMAVGDLNPNRVKRKILPTRNKSPVDESLDAFEKKFPSPS